MRHLNVGLIGAGGISHVHADAWRALGANVRVYSLHGAEELATEYGFDVAESLEDAFAHADIVDIVTPTDTHVPLARAAIAAGLHVICEKPLALTAAEARQLADAAEAAGVRLFPAHVVRYFAEYRAIKERVAAGAIGTPATQRFYRMGSAPVSSWFFQERRGGGIVRDLMIHDIDQAVWLAGPVTTVYAAQNPPSADDTVPNAVTAHVVLTHASGVISHVQGSWLPQGMPFRVGVEIAGAEGRLTYSSAEDRALLIDTVVAGTEDYVPPMSSGDTPYRREIADFVASVETGADALVGPADAVAAVAVIDAAYMSLATGEPVRVAEALR